MSEESVCESPGGHLTTGSRAGSGAVVGQILGEGLFGQTAEIEKK